LSIWLLLVAVAVVALLKMMLTGKAEAVVLVGIDAINLARHQVVAQALNHLLYQLN
jgi:hypothetical protein